MRAVSSRNVQLDLIYINGKEFSNENEVPFVMYVYGSSESLYMGIYR